MQYLIFFKRSFDNEVENGPKRISFKKISKELTDLGESQMGLISFLEKINPFDSDGEEGLEEDLSMTSSSQDNKSLLEKCFDENTQIPYKERGEVDQNNEFDDLEPSLYIGEMEKEECKLECQELPRDIIEFVEAPLEELPGYILEFEEEPILKFYVYAQSIPGKFGRVDAHIDPHKLRGKLSPKLIEIWEWDTFPWDPRVWGLEEKF